MGPNQFDSVGGEKFGARQA